MPLLSARGVTKTYHTPAIDVEALKNVDLDIEQGEMVMIMGPSGNGKTTLLNCLSGLDTINAGTVHIDGTEIHTLSDGKRTKHRAESMGFIFQSYNLIPVLNAAENVELPLLVTGMAPKEARAASVEMLEKVGLVDRVQHHPNQLSGGEQQRVTIARALVSKPAIVWADEPTGNLDSETAADILSLISELHRGGQTVVMVTHDQAIGRMGDRLVILRNGQVHSDEQISQGASA